MPIFSALNFSSKQNVAFIIKYIFIQILQLHFPSAKNTCHFFLHSISLFQMQSYIHNKSHFHLDSTITSPLSLKLHSSYLPWQRTHNSASIQYNTSLLPHPVASITRSHSIPGADVRESHLRLTSADYPWLHRADQALREAIYVSSRPNLKH